MSLLVPHHVRECPVPLLRRSQMAHPERELARGKVVKVRRGVYAPAAAWRELPPWARYVARVHAVALQQPDAVFVLESSAALQGLPVFGDPLTVHVLESSATASRAVGGVRFHTSAENRDLVSAGGMVMTSRADTAVDLARVRHPVIGLAMADAVLRADSSATREMLSARNEARTSSRGRNIARGVLESATPIAESVLETVSRAVVEWLGFPRPTLQQRFRSLGFDDRGDFWWEAERILGEADGDIKYDGRFGDPLDALRRRRERDVRLRASVRSIQHWGWPEVVGFVPLRHILLSAGLRQVAPEQTAILASMRRALSP